MSSEASDSSKSEKRTGLVLSNLQHRLITTALAALSLFVIFAFLFLLFRLLYAFVNDFSSVIMPLAVAGILTLLLRPIVNFMEQKTRLNRLGAIILLLVLATLALTAFLWFLIPIIIDQSIQFIRSLPEIYDGIREFVEERFPQLINFLNEAIGEERLTNLGKQVQDQLSKSAQSILMTVGSVGLKYFVYLFSLAAGIAIIPVYLFFFLRSDPVSQKEIKRQMSWIDKDIREDILFLGKHFANSIEAFFQGQILVGLIMGVLLASGFTVAGIHFGFVVGMFIGLLNIIPYLGTIIGLGTVLPIAYLQPEGGTGLALVALAIFVVVQIIEGYLLTPKIMGNRTGLHPLTVIIAIFFWGTALNGILGMILAIPLTAFFVVAWRLLREKYLNRWTRETA